MKTNSRIIILIAGVLALVGIVLAIVSILFGGLGSGLSRAGTSERKVYTYDANKVKKLEIRDTSGTVSVVGGSGSEVTVSLSQREAENYRVELSGSGNLVVEREERQNWFDFLNFDPEEYTLTVTVPSTLKLDADVSTSSGSVELRDFSRLGEVSCKSTSGSVCGEQLTVQGDCTLTATSGSVKAESVDIGGALRLETSSGSIALRRCTAQEDLEISNTSGSIALEDVETDGDVRAENSSGGIKAETLRAENISFETSSGSIHFDGMEGEDIRLQATSGSIHGQLSGDPGDYIIEAHSTSGSVDVPNSGSGDARLSAKATSGSIDIEFR